MEQRTKAIMRKRNMKLYPIYEMFGLDFMFYYVIELLFFIQVKGLAAADVVLLESFFVAFSIFMQLIVVTIPNKIGKKNSIVLGNALNLVGILTILLGNHFSLFVIAKAIKAMGFGLKAVSEATFLNSTLPKTKRQGEIFTKIDGKGYAKYSYFRAISTLIAGFLFEVNPYIPMFLCAICITFSMMINGCITLINIDYRIQAMVITVLCTIIYIFKGVYQIIKKRYMANFMKSDTLVQIYSINSIVDNLVRMLVSYIASVTLNFLNIRYAILFIGVVFTGVVCLISLYMKSRVGLKPEEYGEKDVEIVK